MSHAMNHHDKTIALLGEAKATIAELLALIDAHNAAPCPQVFKVEVPAKYMAQGLK